MGADPEITLGVPVVIDDYLMRVTARSEQLVALSRAWHDVPPKVLERAQEVIRARKAHGSTAYWPRRSDYFKVWVPVSMVVDSTREPWGWLDQDSRYHPTPWPGAGIELPLEGIVVQQAQVQDGQSDYGAEEGHYFDGLSSRRGYRVAYSLHRRPLLVRPEMIREVG